MAAAKSRHWLGAHPIDTGGMSSTLKVVLGLLIGLVTGGFVWLFAPVVGLYLLVFNETRKYFIRNHAKNRIVRLLKF